MVSHYNRILTPTCFLKNRAAFKILLLPLQNLDSLNQKFQEGSVQAIAPKTHLPFSLDVPHVKFKFPLKYKFLSRCFSHSTKLQEQPVTPLNKI